MSVQRIPDDVTRVLVTSALELFGNGIALERCQAVERLVEFIRAPLAEPVVEAVGEDFGYQRVAVFDAFDRQFVHRNDLPLSGGPVPMLVHWRFLR